MRTCSHFISVSKLQTNKDKDAKEEKDAKKDKDSKECQCGYNISGHTQRSPETTTKKWNYKLHTTKEPTNAFGRIQFVEDNISEIPAKESCREQQPQYVRVEVDTSMSDMSHLIRKVWKLEEKKPDLIISVTGGAKGFKMSKRLTKTLRGLSQLASEACIVTGGTYAGVMKDVGEAIKELDIDSKPKKHVSLGIATWGCIQNNHILSSRVFILFTLRIRQISSPEKKI